MVVQFVSEKRIMVIDGPDWRFARETVEEVGAAWVRRERKGRRLRRRDGLKNILED